MITSFNLTKVCIYGGLITVLLFSLTVLMSYGTTPSFPPYKARLVSSKQEILSTDVFSVTYTLFSQVPNYYTSELKMVILKLWEMVVGKGR